jgi:hypothetical protein
MTITQSFTKLFFTLYEDIFTNAHFIHKLKSLIDLFKPNKKELLHLSLCISFFCNILYKTFYIDMCS